jgi:carboxyl-terminal processing protease
MLRAMDDEQARPDGITPGTNEPEAAHSAERGGRPGAPPTPGPTGISRAAVLGLLLGGVLLFFLGIGVGRIGADQAAFIPSGAPSTSAAPGSASAAPPATTPVPTSRPTAAPGTPKADFGLAQEAWDILFREYVDRGSLDPTALERGAVRGMVEAVGDTGHTMYLSPDELQRRNDGLSGEFVGIGVVVDERDGYVQVLRVLPDSPALRGGVVAGDRIVAVDGQTAVGKTVEEVARVIRGPAGTRVQVTIQAPGGPERALTLVRQKLDLPLASWAMVPGSTTAMVRLESFSVGSADALASALTEARAAGATSILFDLRGNGGGYTDQAIAVASQFLKDGVVYRSVDKDGKEIAYQVKPDGVATDLPMAVLVDGLTASSAEIVAGALQDAGRARIVGERTSGTGTVLGTWDLSDGSAVSVGFQRWLTPDGSSIWKEGITPDVAVSLPSGVGVVVPDDLAGLGAAGVATTTDAQLHAGLEELRRAR